MRNESAVLLHDLNLTARCCQHLVVLRQGEVVAAGPPQAVLTQTLGTVSMDMIAVDLSHCPDARIGSDVELWGKNLPVDDVASAAGTSGYELLSATAARVPRCAR